MKGEPDERSREREMRREREMEKREKIEKVKLHICNHCFLMRSKCFFELISPVTIFSELELINQFRM